MNTQVPLASLTRRIAADAIAKKDVTGKLCYSSRFPCYKAHRDCDPVLCVDCDARYVFLSYFCSVNVIDSVNVKCEGIHIRKPPASALTRLS